GRQIGCKRPWSHREQKDTNSCARHRKCCDEQNGKRPIRLGHRLSPIFDTTLWLGLTSDFDLYQTTGARRLPSPPESSTAPPAPEDRLANQLIDSPNDARRRRPEGP